MEKVLKFIFLIKISELNDLSIEMDKKWMTLTLRLPEKVAPQQAKLSLEFEFVHDNKMHGFYRSTYKNASGEEKHLLSTQFEVFLFSLLLTWILEYLCTNEFSVLGWVGFLFNALLYFLKTHL